MPELGSQEWYRQAIADAREVWHGAPPNTDRRMSRIDHHEAFSGSGVSAQRQGRAPSFHPPLEAQLCQS